MSGRFSATMGGTSGCNPSKRVLISSRSSSILSTKSTRTRITFLAAIGCWARLASKSWALFTTSPVCPMYVSNFWLKARERLSLSNAFRCASSLSSSLAFLDFSYKNAILASSSSNLFCEGRWSIASKSSSGWTFPSRLHTS